MKKREIDPTLANDKLVQLKKTKSLLEKYKKQKMALRCKVAPTIAFK